jgi:ubiquinone/menaquinone biosynthesis C-methylase UbiE
VHFKPWLGDLFSFLYDYIMSHSIFPKKFGADLQKHNQILTRSLADIHEKRILEIGTGSGSAVKFLNNDNHYTGTDISSGLLKKAVQRFDKAGFPDPEFYLASGDDLPFEDGIFNVCLCILSLNFIGDAVKVIQEVHRILLPMGLFVCCVPVPERNRGQSKIRGVLNTEKELEKICGDNHFRFEPISDENGVLFYFKAINEG